MQSVEYSQEISLFRKGAEDPAFPSFIFRVICGRYIPFTLMGNQTIKSNILGAPENTI